MVRQVSPPAVAPSSTTTTLRPASAADTQWSIRQFPPRRPRRRSYIAGSGGSDGMSAVAIQSDCVRPLSLFMVCFRRQRRPSGSGAGPDGRRCRRKHTMNSDNGRTQSVWMATADMPSEPPLPGDVTTDVCVVGAGIAGLTTAYRLAKAVQRVVVVDDGPTAGGETCRTTAHLVNALDDRY